MCNDFWGLADFELDASEVLDKVWKKFVARKLDDTNKISVCAALL